MKKIGIIILILCLSFKTNKTFAWGSEGHKIVAEIAQKKLNKGVEQKVQKYLGDMTFEQTAVWMDEIRNDHTYDYMKPWHYVNIEKDATYVKAPKGDVVSELEIVINELKNYKKMKEEDVKTDLKILFHLCGDITQPLHCGYGSDKGGNTIDVEFLTKKSNLHRVWDSEIITEEKITSESCFKILEKYSEKEITSIQKIDVMEWMNDSRSFLSSVYDFKDNAITENYISSNKEIIEKQLAKGGLRLAEVLNEVFK